MSNDQRESRIVRASVYDAFVQLGGLNEDGLVKQWMFGETSSPLTEGRGRNGVRFRDTVLTSPVEERVFYDETEEENGGRSVTAPLRFNKWRSKSKLRTRKDGEGSQEAGDRPTSPASSHTKSPKGKRLFFRKPTSPSSPESSTAPTSIEDRAVSGPLVTPPQRTSSKTLKTLFRKDIPPNSQGKVVPHDDLTFPKLTDVESNGGKADVEAEPRQNDLEKVTTAKKRLSYAVPQTAFQSLRRLGEKSKPPNLAPIVTNNSRNTAISPSQSLPPSPFLLVTPDAWNDHDQKEDGSQAPPTPYVLCSPVDEAELRKRLSSPIQSKLPPTIPISISKAVRDSSNDNELITFQSTTQVENDMARMTASMCASQNAPSSFTSQPAKRRTSLRARESPFPIRPIRAVPLSSM